ncbi:hypothetical protein LQW54_012326 [Pestalotiopsis sp. IQ-011]
MPAPYRRVAVIGAGPSGAIATDALVKEQAFDTIRVFDRRAGIGGTWIHTPHLPAAIPSLREILSGTADKAVAIPEVLPAVTQVSEEVNGYQPRFSDTAIHEHLHSNITPEIMSFSTHPFPTILSSRTLSKYGPKAPFRHHSIIRDWVEGVFKSSGHEKLLELSTTVERAVKAGAEWILTLRKEVNGRNYWWREKFDALVVATGHYNIPWFPEIDGLLDWEQKFPGSVVHSKHFRGPKRFEGKKVLVVGGSISSHEIVHEILEAAQAPVYAAIRGEPNTAFGWVPFEHPKIEIRRRQISRLDAATGRVHFADGTYLDNLDHIVFGTGHTSSFPFRSHVQERASNAYRRLPGVWQHTWDIEDPSPTFVGMLGGGFTFRVYEHQAVAVARHLADRARPLPPVDEQLEWERSRVAEKKGGKDYYSIAFNYEEFFELLRTIAGDPANDTTGRKLEPFRKDWLDSWSGMVSHRLEGWRRKKKRA